MTVKNEISYKQEVLRKGIHLFSLSIPLIYIFIPRQTALVIMIILTSIALLIDIASKRENIVRTILYRIFGKMLREHEVTKWYTLNGASWVLISSVICIFFFPKIITVTAFTVLIISDMSAALYGRKFGKHKFLDKSLEGTSAFIITAIAVVLIYAYVFSAPAAFIISGIAGGIVAGLTEAASIRLKLDDNLSIPVSMGIVMYLGSVIGSNYGQAFIEILI